MEEHLGQYYSYVASVAGHHLATWLSLSFSAFYDACYLIRRLSRKHYTITHDTLYAREMSTYFR